MRCRSILGHRRRSMAAEVVMAGVDIAAVDTVAVAIAVVDTAAGITNSR